jgi:hypothetical protein
MNFTQKIYVVITHHINDDNKILQSIGDQPFMEDNSQIHTGIVTKTIQVTDIQEIMYVCVDTIDHDATNKLINDITDVLYETKLQFPNLITFTEVLRLDAQVVNTFEELTKYNE